MRDPPKIRYIGDQSSHHTHLRHRGKCLIIINAIILAISPSNKSSLVSFNPTFRVCFTVNTHLQLTTLFHVGSFPISQVLFFSRALSSSIMASRHFGSCFASLQSLGIYVDCNEAINALYAQDNDAYET
jgi:hypothetical protein